MTIGSSQVGGLLPDSGCGRKRGFDGTIAGYEAYPSSITYKATVDSDYLAQIRHVRGRQVERLRDGRERRGALDWREASRRLIWAGMTGAWAGWAESLGFGLLAHGRRRRPWQFERQRVYRRLSGRILWGGGIGPRLTTE